MIPLAVPCVYVIVSVKGYWEINQTELRWVGRFTSSRVLWHEVVRVKSDGLTFNVYGRRSFVSFAPSLMRSTDRLEFLTRFYEQLQERGVSITKDRFASYRFRAKSPNKR
jgi:hypothetical protein